MTLFSKLLAAPAALGFIACILYVLFGQITVRKLRKNPETKHALGLEMVSGWDIINVAQALSIPSFLTKKLSASKIAFLYANTEALRSHTTKLDRMLGVLFYYTFMTSGLLLGLLAALEAIGIFES